MKNRIPIFPLKLVLFPESKYPLHIFEERYKNLINWCIRTGDGFGIVSNIDSNFSKVGCLAIVEKVLNTHSDGSFDILVTGIERFKMKSTVLGSEGYLEANISPYQDKESSQFEETLYNNTVDKLLEVLKIAKVELENEFWANLTISSVKSFKLAEKAGMNLKQRQKILTLQSETERLNYLKKHLVKIEDLITKDLIAQKLIASDGYVNK